MHLSHTLTFPIHRRSGTAYRTVHVACEHEMDKMLRLEAECPSSSTVGRGLHQWVTGTLHPRSDFPVSQNMDFPQVVLAATGELKSWRGTGRDFGGAREEGHGFSGPSQGSTQGQSLGNGWIRQTVGTVGNRRLKTELLPQLFIKVHTIGGLHPFSFFFFSNNDNNNADVRNSEVGEEQGGKPGQFGAARGQLTRTSVPGGFDCSNSPSSPAMGWTPILDAANGKRVTVKAGAF
jgi:hypothetical protein